MALWTTLLSDQSQLPLEVFPWGTLQWLCNGASSPGATMTLGLCQLQPGQRNPSHYHPNCEEVLYLQSGAGRHLLGDEWLELRAGMTLRIPLGVRHQLVNTSQEPLLCVIAFSSGQRETVFLDES